MPSRTVKLPDGSSLELVEGATGADAAAAIGPRLAKEALAVRVNREVRDLAAPLADGVRPTEDDLEPIEERMAAHIAADEAFERSELAVDEAIERFRAEDQPYKVELIEDLIRDEGATTVSLYRNGPFVDLCRGPHGPSTGRIKAFKLSSIAGAYWRGDETRQMLTRIYGTAFFSRRELEEHLERLEQARARDHRRLGPQLGLFILREEAPGMPFWLPDGVVLLRLIERQVRGQLKRRGYVEIKTPQVLDEELWHRSGHWENYRQNMFFVESSERERADARRFALRPMNCPGACLVYASERRSYRDLPLRLAEFGHVSRYEREGVLHGLLRVRAFTQDDAHVYCTLDQVTDEVDSICQAIDELYARFGFDDVRVELSTRPERSIGSADEWERAEASLREALARQRREYEVSPGEGTFYGPKIDFHVTDALGRSWQCGTCQLDFQMPERFELSYQGADNAEHRPVMIHRALLGSMERFVGILIEHYGGRFPVWLAPVQALILPVADRHNLHATELADRLRDAGLRCRVDARSESVAKKIHDAEIAKAPYMLV